MNPSSINAHAANPEEFHRRLTRARADYVACSEPLIRRMAELRLLYTTPAPLVISDWPPKISDIGPPIWTDPAAEATYANLARTLDLVAAMLLGDLLPPER